MCEEGAAEGERKVFEFGPEHLASCSSRVAGWDDSFHTEVRSESMNDVCMCLGCSHALNVQYTVIYLSLSLSLTGSYWDDGRRQ